MSDTGIVVQKARLTFDGANAPIIEIERTFEIRRGCSLLVAPSGGGKTSLLRLLSGWFTPSEEVRPAFELLANYDPLRDVEFIGNHQTLLPWFSVRKNIAIRGGDLSKAEANWRAVGLPASTFEKYPYELSLGMYKRAELVAAYSHSPRLLLLDEFFSSLDPEASALSMALIEAHAGAAGAVLITTHTPEAFSQVDSKLGFRYGPKRQVVDISLLQ